MAPNGVGWQCYGPMLAEDYFRGSGTAILLGLQQFSHSMKGCCRVAGNVFKELLPYSFIGDTELRIVCEGVQQVLRLFTRSLER